MLWFFLFAGTVAVIELLVRLPIKSSSLRILEAVGKSAKTLAAKKVSDHWKQAILLACVRRLFLSSVYLFVLLLIAASPMIIIGIACAAVKMNFFRFMATTPGILASSIVALLYFHLRKQFVHGGL